MINERLRAKIDKTDVQRKLYRYAIKASLWDDETALDAAMGKLRDKDLIMRLWQREASGGKSLRSAIIKIIDSQEFLMTTAWEAGFHREIIDRLEDTDFLKKVAADLKEGDVSCRAAQRLLEIAPEAISDEELAGLALLWQRKDPGSRNAGRVKDLIRDPKIRKKTETEQKPYVLWYEFRAYEKKESLNKLLDRIVLPEDLCGALCDRFVAGSYDTRIIDAMERLGYAWANHVNGSTVRAMIDDLPKRGVHLLPYLRTVYRERPDLRHGYHGLAEKSWTRQEHQDTNCVFGHTDEPKIIQHMVYIPGENLVLDIEDEIVCRN